MPHTQWITARGEAVPHCDLGLPCECGKELVIFKRGTRTTVGAERQRRMDGPVIVAIQDELVLERHTSELLRQMVIDLEQQITGHLGTIAGLRRNAKDYRDLKRLSIALADRCAELESWCREHGRWAVPEPKAG